MDVDGDGYIRMGEWLAWLRDLGTGMSRMLDDLQMCKHDMQRERQLSRKKRHDSTDDDNYWELKLSAMRQEDELRESKLDSTQPVDSSTAQSPLSTMTQKPNASHCRTQHLYGRPRV